MTTTIEPNLEQGIQLQQDHVEFGMAAENLCQTMSTVADGDIHIGQCLQTIRKAVEKAAERVRLVLNALYRQGDDADDD